MVMSPSVLQRSSTETRDVIVGYWNLPGSLCVPSNASALVIFAHGSGSSRFSVRNREVARALTRAGMATLMFDLLNADEKTEPGETKPFDISILAERLVDAIKWVDRISREKVMPIGLFGASTGTAAALVAASELGDRISAVVSRGGRPDLAGRALEKVRAATLLIVGGDDHGVVELNQHARHRLKGIAALEIVPGATHLFGESGALGQVKALSTAWFERYLTLTPT